MVQRLHKLTPSQILLIGWLGFLLYAFPGYMSYDSVFQLRESRFGVFGDNHPPALAVLWRVVELFVAGPFGMLVIQSVTFLYGLFLVFEKRMSGRAAAIAASLVLWFPPILAVMAVIWKDSQMAGFLMLGFGLLLSDRRRTRLLGLAALLVATMMRYNALACTFPIVLVCFTWKPEHRFWKRHLLAFGAWLGITVAAQLFTTLLTDEKRHYWHANVALCDIIGTLRHMPNTIPDEELRAVFAGINMRNDKDIHVRARADGPLPLYENLQRETFARVLTPTHREAVVRAWKTIVLGNKDAYLAYRWTVFKKIIGIDIEHDGSPIYTWFTDIQAPHLTAAYLEHNAHAGKIQEQLQTVMHEVGGSAVFRVLLYVILAVVLLPFALRDRDALALLGSAIASEVVLFILAPTTDWRYSFWLILATVAATILIVARRAHTKSDPLAKGIA